MKVFAGALPRRFVSCIVVVRGTHAGPNAGRTTIPLFFFNLHTADSVDRDEEGVELPDIETAYLEAFHTATEIWIEEIRHRHDPSQHRFEITDARGQVLTTLPFMEILEKRPNPRKQPAAQAATHAHDEKHDRQGRRRQSRVRARQMQPRFEELLLRAAHSRNLGATVMDQIRVARQQLDESKALLARLGPPGR